ncbi:Putative ribosomal protein S21 [Septoria linicola]|uniref:Ribosomal protein S21 n=1 Tax=Septoria linicola TaxID=215465 RepID=A0A9Q9AYR3_9PEZI|nr:Putative ribosomal protein S21 [Septoria linicola]
MAPSRAGEALFRLAAARRLSLAQSSHTATPFAHFCRGQQAAATARAFTASTPCRSEDSGRNVPSKSSINDDISNLLDSTLDLNKGTPTTTASRNSRFKSRDAQQNTGSRAIANELDRSRSSRGGNSVDELLETMVSGSARQQHKRPTNSNYGADIYDIFPGGSGGQPELTKDLEPVILPPNVGRLVEVDEKRNMDVARAFRTMEIQCNKNRVKRSFAQQRFHERPGLKRKRLKNERWIKRFKENFKGTVQLVQKMKKQGW